MTDLTKRDDALLPCPFCGGDKNIICCTDYDDRDAYAVSCRYKECHGAIFTLGYGYFADKAEAIAAWNTRALPAVTVGVKPLVWEKDSLKGSYPTRFRAKMPCKGGDYSVAGSERKNLWQWFRNGYFVDGHQLHEPMPLNAAKAAAQADYEARILAALTPTPVADSQPADPVVNDPAAIREAALEAKLAKAVEALRFYTHDYVHSGSKARAVLAELDGGSEPNKKQSL